MIHRIMILAGTPALLLAIPAAAQNWNNNQGGRSPAYAGRATVMHAGPEPGYPQVRRIPQGQQVQIYGCLNDRSWCDVGYGNDRGWISAPDLYADYGGRRDTVANLFGNMQLGSLTFSIGNYWDDNYRQQPFYGERYRWEQHYFDRYQSSWGPRPNQSYWGNQSVAGYMQRRAWVLSGPDFAYPRVGIIYARTQVMIHGCLRDWSWCDISHRANRGWVSGRDLAGTWQGRRQIIPSIAPYLGIGILSFSFGNYWDNHYRAQPFYRDRDRWQRQYVQNYRPTWGAGPNQNQQYRSQQTQAQQQNQLQRDRVQAQQRQQAQAQAQRNNQRDRLEAQQEAQRNDQRDRLQAQQQAQARQQAQAQRNDQRDRLEARQTAQVQQQARMQAQRADQRERVEAQAAARKQDAERRAAERREPKP